MSFVRKAVIIVEDFYADPLAVRDYALRQRFYYPYELNASLASGRERFTWMASWFREAQGCPFKSSQALIRKLEGLTGEEVDMEHWNRSFPVTEEGKAAPDFSRVPHSCLWNCCFHFKPDIGQQIGAGVHNHVTDGWNEVGRTGWAGLIYMSPDAPLSSGLRLWRNRDPERNFDWMTPREDWEMVDAFGNVFNRLILCRGDLPHSGANGWSDLMETGRLYQTFFFKVKDYRPGRSLRVTF